MTRAAPPRPDGWPDSAQWLPRARRLGSLRFSDLGSRALVPPEPVDELAAWLVDAADSWWEAAGRPDPWTLVVVSGDDGTLAARFLQAGPACLTALRYVLAHPGPRPPGMAARVPLEDPVFLFPAAPADDPEDVAPPATGVGPLLTCLSEPPASSGEGMVVAIRLLSRLPSDRLQYGPEGWQEIRLAASRDQLVEVTSPLADPPGPPIPAWSSRPAEGRYAVHCGAADWLRRELSSEWGAALAVVDEWTERTEPLDRGDRPAPLPIDQLSRIRRPDVPSPVPVAAGLSVVTWGSHPVG